MVLRGPPAQARLFQKVFGGTGILPVQRTGWKPVPNAFSCFMGEPLVHEELS
jgi:hypothetical protein